jgi:hypothetical protein
VNTMSTYSVNFVERKRHEALSKIETWLKNGEISHDAYLFLVRQNDRLANQLSMVFLNRQKLIQDRILDNLSEILNYRKKPTSNKEAFELMRSLIISGSEKPLIRKTAIQLAEKSSKERQSPVPIPEVDKLYVKLPTDRQVENTIAFIKHCGNTAKDIFAFVKKNSIHVCDPPDDFFQDPQDTLGIMNLRGDCDDLAILLCSLYRSIGYRTFLGFLPNHVFAGVLLAQYSKPRFRENKTLESIDISYVLIPTDPQLEDLELQIEDQKISIDLFDAIDNFQTIAKYFDTKAAESPSIEETNISKIERIFLQKIKYLSQAEIYSIDDPIPNAIYISSKILNRFQKKDLGDDGYA